MATLFMMIAEREADARAAAEELHTQIAKLTDQLAAVQTELSRLQVTHETATSLGYTEPDGSIAADTTIAQPAYLGPSSPSSNAPTARCAPDSCASSLTSAPNPNTARACARASSAWPPAASSPRPSPACSPSSSRPCPGSHRHDALRARPHTGGVEPVEQRSANPVQDFPDDLLDQRQIRIRREPAACQIRVEIAEFTQ